MKSPSKARLFIAIDLPDDAREELVRWQQAALGDRDDLRLVGRKALHVTLVFLGHLPETEIRTVERVMKAALPDIEPPVMTAAGVKRIPPRRPRLFALELDDQAGRAGIVQTALGDALETAGLYEREKRPFWPHVTLARVRKDVRARPFEAVAPPAEPWPAAAVTLYRSRLSPKGADYEPLSVLRLLSTPRG